MDRKERTNSCPTLCTPIPATYSSPQNTEHGFRATVLHSNCTPIQRSRLRFLRSSYLYRGTEEVTYRFAIASHSHKIWGFSRGFLMQAGWHSWTGREKRESQWRLEELSRLTQRRNCFPLLGKVSQDSKKDCDHPWISPCSIVFLSSTITIYTKSIQN